MLKHTLLYEVFPSHIPKARSIRSPGPVLFVVKIPDPLYLQDYFQQPLWERSVLIVSTKSSAVLTVIFFGLWEFRRQNVSVPEVLGTTKR